MPDNRPNILLLLTDQLRFDAIQALGGQFGAQTPAMNSLVNEGVTFTQCHCTAPICSPSRSTLMTGLYPSQAGMPGNLYSPCPPLSPALNSIGKRMRTAGYQTAYHGKWHLGGHVQAHGFEVGEEDSHDASTRAAAARFWRNRDWMENERPFFHVVSFLDPHDIYFFDRSERVENFELPWRNTRQPKSDYPSAVQSKRVAWPESRWGAYHTFYRERIERVDHEIGLLLEELRCSGFSLNTWIIFASDHGDMAGEQDIPFKGSFMYEGVTHVPLVVIPPSANFGGDFSRSVPLENIPPKKCHGLCSLLDITPTILDIAEDDSDDLPGHSLMPWVLGQIEGAPHETVFAEWHKPPVRMARTAEWKYVRYYDGAEELFNLQADPHETSNLANDIAFREALMKMREKLDGHIESTQDPWQDLVRDTYFHQPAQLSDLPSISHTN